MEDEDETSPFFKRASALTPLPVRVLNYRFKFLFFLGPVFPQQINLPLI